MPPAGLRLRVAVVGCGLISERSHIPALLRSGRADIAALVDRQIPRARALAGQFGLSCPVTDSLAGVLGSVDAAVVAVPNSLHAEVTGALLERGVHVLCEKPLALSASDAGALSEQAERKGLVLAVGFVTRYHEVTELLRDVLAEGLVGEVRGYDLAFGVNFAWPAVSAFYFQRDLSGGGVLMNEAIHTLDRLIYWFGDVETVDYRDNNAGGVETECVLALTHHREGTRMKGTARFSWLCTLRNTLEVQGTDGKVVVWKDERSSVGIYRTVRGQPLLFEVRRPQKTAREPLDYFALQVEDFIDAIRTGRCPRVGGREGAASVALVEEAYRRRMPLELPWAKVAS